MTRVQSEAAKAAGLPVEKVIVNNHLLGGGFGRKLEPDMVVAAVRIAKQVDGPVKVVWTREEDIQHDVYRPVYRDTIAATLSDGKIAGWKYQDHRLVDHGALAAAGVPERASTSTRSIAPSICPTTSRISTSNMCGPSRRRCRPASGAASDRTTMCSRSNASWTSWRARPARTRSSSAASMLGNKPRMLAALKLAAEKSGWGQPLPARVGRGVCVQPSFDSFIATVVEAEVDEQGEVRLRRITSVVDTGIAVNPDTIMAQLRAG